MPSRSRCCLSGLDVGCFPALCLPAQSTLPHDLHPRVSPPHLPPPVPHTDQYLLTLPSPSRPPCPSNLASHSKSASHAPAPAGLHPSPHSPPALPLSCPTAAAPKAHAPAETRSTSYPSPSS